MSISTIAIAGITGQLGTLIAQALLKTSDVQIRGLCRNTAKLSPEFSRNSRVNIVQGDSNDLAAAREAVRDCQVVICCYLGPNELMSNGQKVLIDACVAEAVPRYIASDYSIDYRALKLGQLPAKDPMIEIHEYLEGKPVTGVHVLIGCFTETFLNYIPYLNLKDNQLSYWGTGKEKWDFTTYGTCAEYVAAAALDAGAQGFLKFRADSISIKEMAKFLKDSPTIKELGSMDELKTKVDTAREKGNVGFMEMPLFYTYFIQNGQTTFGDGLDSARYLQVKPVTLEAHLRKMSVA